ncbi:EF-hand domain-containing protein [Dokdonella sp.]|uniref:EF-hand domain-containing protein n=1 Tax=Dokdonella sp. TaxID=2291710 RepID=UPI003527C40E
MKLPRIKNPLFAVTLVLLSFAAYAEKSDNVVASRDAAPEWTDADTNRDGYLSKEELMPFPTLGQDYAEIDTNDDGKISQTEYVDWMDPDHSID